MIKFKPVRIMSKILASLVFLAPLQAMGGTAPLDAGVVAPGHVFYKAPDGALVKRELNLTVPPRGEGEITLSTDRWSASTSHFFSKEVAGGIEFTVVFVKPFPEHSESSLVLTGSYMRGSNAAVYWGDLYKTKTALTDPMIRLLEITQLSPRVAPFLRHVGGFKFKADIVPETPSEPNQPVPNPPSPDPAPSESFFFPN
jgi:hypothetical protein